MDENLTKLVKQVIKEELGEIVSKELEIRLEPFLRIAKENRNGIDEVKEQLREDRRDIDTILIGQAKSEKQNKVIIENQNTQEDRVVEAVKEEAQKIPKAVEKSVDRMFEQKGFLKRIRAKFLK